MKEQYVGDVNDYRKYALLRHLAQQGRIRIGVCWMLTPPDAGNLRDYLKQADRWRGYDPELFDQIRAVIEQRETNRLGAIESSGIIPNARFVDALLTDKTKRATYFEAALSDLAEADLIFFDPDNGVAANPPNKQPRRSSKFIYLHEIAAAYERQHSILIYQHFPRVQRDQFIGKLGMELAHLSASVKLWYFRTPFAVFFLLIHPNHSAALVTAAEAVPDRWRPRFISGERLC